MAIQISKATGNFTSSSTWSPTETGTNAQQTTHSTAQTISGNANASTPAFTGTNLDVCDGVLLWVARGGTTGTVLVELQAAGVTVASVTVNNSDLPVNKSPVFFKFTATFAMTGAAYTIKVSVSSGGSTLTVYRDGTASNFAKQIRLTSSGTAPAAGDVMIVVGELTGAGTNNAFTVTMNETATTIYGTNVQAVATVPHTTQNGIDMGVRGTLQYGTTASTNYYLKVAGHIGIWDGGIVNIGSNGTRIPSTSSAVLEFQNDAVAKFGLEINSGATFNVYGDNVSNISAYLNADAAAAATSLTTDISTGWKSGNIIAVASTTRTASESEQRTLSSDASGTTVPIDALTNAHSGAGSTNGALVKAELILLTRNVKIRSSSSTNTYYGYVSLAATIHVEYAEHQYLGSITINKRGAYDCATPNGATGVLSLTYNSFRDSATQATSHVIFINVGDANHVTISNNVAYNLGRTFVFVTSTSGTDITINSNWAIRSSDGSNGLLEIRDLGIIFTNNVAVSAAGAGIVYYGENGIFSLGGTFSGNRSHSNGGAGFAFLNGGFWLTVFSSHTSYRNNLGGVSSNYSFEVILDSPIIFGNLSGNITGVSVMVDWLVKSPDIQAGLVLTSTTGIRFAPLLLAGSIIVENGNIGTSQTHSSGDIYIDSQSPYVQCTLLNTNLASSIEVGQQTSLSIKSYISSQKHDQTAGLHKTWLLYGTITIDAVIYDVSPSMRITPNNASNKVIPPFPFTVAIPNGSTASISVKVRKSVSGDGAAYNGNQPRLIVKKNVAAGVSADTVLATDGGSGSSSTSWGSGGTAEILTGTTPAITDNAVLEFYVDCDGTTGWINVDTIIAT